MAEQQQPRQRVRGISFKQEYSSSGQPQQTTGQPQQSTLFQRMKAKLASGGGESSGRARAPSMLQDPDKDLVPPKDPSLLEKITVVLDLDETLIYAREGPLYARPGLDELLNFLQKHCEAIVWTAGVKAYAQAVVRNIDKYDAVKHIVYRHKKWFTGCAGYNKDLTLLGRDMSTTVIIENTPDCVRGNETNGILVSDYEGGELPDTTLPAITALLADMVERRKREKITVPQYVQSSRLLTRQMIPTDVGDTMSCYCLDINDAEIFLLQKGERVNQDLPQ